MHPSHMSALDFSPILYLLHFLKVQARSLYVVWPAEKGVTSCLPEDHLTCRNILSLPCHIHTHKKYRLLETLNLSGYTDSSTNNKNKTPNYGNTKKKVYLYKEVPQRTSLSVALPYRGNAYVSQVPQKENFLFYDTSRSQALLLIVNLVFIILQSSVLVNTELVDFVMRTWACCGASCLGSCVQWLLLAQLHPPPAPPGCRPLHPQQAGSRTPPLLASKHRHGAGDGKLQMVDQDPPLYGPRKCTK